MESASVLDMLWEYLKEKKIINELEQDILSTIETYMQIPFDRDESMIKVHDRMPLILEKEQLEDWFDDRKIEQILHQVPVQLKREAEYEQQSLFL